MKRIKIVKCVTTVISVYLRLQMILTFGEM